jgi:hypothetical protein
MMVPVSRCYQWNVRLVGEVVQGILSSCSGTLEELELELRKCWNHHAPVMLPVLPKLKLPVVRCEDYRMVKVSCQDFLGKFPKLERCVLTLGKKIQ